MVLVVQPFWGFVRAKDISLGLLPPRNHHGFVTVRKRVCSSRGKIIDMHCYYFPLIFNLHCGQEVTPIFIG